jgi:sugar O-acyltransferase (sialic acid O-acetyltransferase NeuD family)
MLIIGAKGFAKEVLEICFKNNASENLAFYDDVNQEIGSSLFDRFPILNSIEQAKRYFENIDNRFTIGIGKSPLRKRFVEKFTEIGGVLTSTISNSACIGNFDVRIGDGANILPSVKISNSVLIGKCALIYYNVILTHDVIIGDYVELSPGATILGRAKVNNGAHIGAGAIILPDVVIGENAIIGAGAVVTEDIPDNCTAVGIPAKVIKKQVT